MSHGHGTSESGTHGAEGWKVISGLLLLAAFVLVVAGAKNEIAEYKKEAAAEEARETAAHAATAPAAPVVYEDLSWSFREFDVPKGGQARYLWPGWRADPLGGDLTIITPSGQEVKAKPGKKIDIGWQEAGTYI